MSKHLSKRFKDQEVIDILERYLSGEIDSTVAQRLLDIRRRRFFDLLKLYREAPESFTLKTKRTHVPRKLSTAVEEKILEELVLEKKLIDDKRNPVRRYNYSYVTARLAEKHNIHVSLSSVIRFAKKSLLSCSEKTCQA